MSAELGNETNDSKNEVRWIIHETHPEMVDVLRTKLSEVVDPELGLDIIQLGLVREVAVENEHCKIKMVLTTPFCPYGPEILEMTKIKAEVGTGGPVLVELLPDVIWSTEMMEDPSALDWGMYY